MGVWSTQQHLCPTPQAAVLLALACIHCGDIPVADLITRCAPPVEAVGMGQDHVCAVASGGFLFCWGQNAMGQIGDGTTQDALMPVPIPLAAVRAIAGGDDHTCTLAEDGVVRCWGDNAAGQLGGATHEVLLTTPGVVPDVRGQAMSSTLDSTCLIDDSGRLLCWGHNSSGVLGVGDESPRAVPTVVGQLDDWTQVTVGETHACALRSDLLYCWGDGSDGQLGLGDTSSKLEPTMVSPGWTYVAAGDDYTCGIRDDGSLWCWGANDAGQLGMGDRTDRTAPDEVAGVGWSTVAPAQEHTCGIRGAELYCWGDAPGVLSAVRLSPGDALDLGAPVVDVTSAEEQVCALRDDGSLFCWGGNEDGQLGTGDRVSRTDPVEVCARQAD